MMAVDVAEKAQKALQRAKVQLILGEPFFGFLALKLVFEQDDSIKTAATDGRKFYWNAGFVEGLPTAQVLGLVAHETLHCAMGHVWRADGRDHKKWNRACDYAINLILADSGFQLPEGALLDRQFAGMPAEQIYALLPETPAGQDGTSSGQGTPMPGQQGKPDGQGQGQGDPQKQDPQEDGQGDPRPEDWGQILDRSSSPAASTEAAEWKMAATQAAQTAHQKGKLPGGLRKLVQSLRRPAVDWKAELSRFVTQHAKADYRWQKPNRRYLGHGLWLPGLQSETMPPIAVALDTSGSIEDRMLQQFLSEVQGIFDAVKPEALHLLCFHSSVYSHQEFLPGDRIELKKFETGGTDFNPIFRSVEKMEDQPCCLIVLTDLEGFFPREAPEYPVLWACWSNNTAPFGETVPINS